MPRKRRLSASRNMLQDLVAANHRADPHLDRVIGEAKH